jgi:hypothetical protein
LFMEKFLSLWDPHGEERAFARVSNQEGNTASSFETRRRRRSSELVNLLIFAFSDMSQIKDLGPAKTSNFE